MDKSDEVCGLREEVARLDERLKAADKALLVAKAHQLSLVSTILSVFALLIALGAFIFNRH